VGRTGLSAGDVVTAGDAKSSASKSSARARSDVRVRDPRLKLFPMISYRPQQALFLGCQQVLGEERNCFVESNFGIYLGVIRKRTHDIDENETSPAGRNVM